MPGFLKTIRGLAVYTVECKHEMNRARFLWTLYVPNNIQRTFWFGIFHNFFCSYPFAITVNKTENRDFEIHFWNTADSLSHSRSNGSAYNKNPSLTIFSFVPMQLFLLFLYNGYNNISL